VTFIQNHDQIANSATGQRAHEINSPGTFRALTVLLLLGPGTPMLFQGQEFAASRHSATSPTISRRSANSC
jgi:maltooligosyltrehalose trehalohydrolase